MNLGLVDNLISNAQLFSPNGSAAKSNDSTKKFLKNLSKLAESGWSAARVAGNEQTPFIIKFWYIRRGHASATLTATWKPTRSDALRPKLDTTLKLSTSLLYPSRYLQEQYAFKIVIF